MTNIVKDFTTKLPQNLNYILKKINRNLKGLIFVIDEKNKLLGSISDGDIRRGLIKKNISQIVTVNSKFVNNKPFSLNYKTDIKALNSLKEELGLSNAINTIESYDISHHSGSAAVASPWTEPIVFNKFSAAFMM